MAATNQAPRGVGVRIRNTKRAQWFFPFEISDDLAASITDATGKSTCVGIEVQTLGKEVPQVKGPPKIVEVKQATLALGDAEAHVDKGDLTPELVIPVEVWQALLADAVQGKAIRGLISNGEIAAYPDVPLAA